jgi:leader peptidase (prepilin peptidase)/N-methyltransferase
MAEISIKIFIMIMLFFCGIQDLLKKKVLLWVVLAGAVLIAIAIPFCNAISLIDRFGGFLIGISVIVIGIATKGKIGLGDGLLLCVTGIGLGFWGNLELFAIALFLAAILSIILLVSRLADRKKSIPFVPFLLISFIILIIAGR